MFSLSDEIQRDFPLQSLIVADAIIGILLCLSISFSIIIYNFCLHIKYAKLLYAHIYTY